MFLTTVFVYPLVLALLCLGAGLLIDRISGSLLPAALLPSIGVAALVALSQLLTYVYALAPSTPYMSGVAALAGFWLGRHRAVAIARSTRHHPWRVLLPILVYLVALAPVLLAGRASFSSYMVLADSAVHMAGADYLLHHGQHYVHLDLSNSYGQFIHDYYDSNYPSGADTLFGASALLVGAALIWAFQPFNAFVLATACGPAWLLARRAGLSGTWAAAAAFSVVVPALVYAYELFGSIKEVTALGLILALGALVVSHAHWLRAGPRGVIPFALVVGAGMSVLGVAFGVWALAASVVLVPPFVRLLRAEAPARRRALWSLALGAGVVVLAGLSTWKGLGGSVQVAQGVALTSNPGNLAHPLRAIQLFGVWLGGSYKLEPTGVARGFTYALIAFSLVAGVLGVWQLLRRRAFSLLAWIALMLLACLIVAESVSTWGAAKTLMLTSSVVVLLAWAGVAALRALRPRALALGSTALATLVLAGGVVASDASQYHVSNLAPTARYQELARVNKRFAGQGPALFTDFDEYSMYVLRDLDVGGPNFVYPPPATAAAAAQGHGHVVKLDRLAPAVLRGYPLIVMRRDPLATRPPAAYRLAWQGSYYEVWQRRPGAQVARRHVALAASPAAQCASIARLARKAAGVPGLRLSAALVPETVFVSLRRRASPRPRSWGKTRSGVLLRTPGSLRARVVIPTSGSWQLWLRGQFMPPVAVSIDGRRMASVAGQLGGNSLVIAPAPPITVRLSAGVHQLVLTRGGSGLEPGEGGAAVLSGVFLTPAGDREATKVLRVLPSRWASLCGRRYEWVELSVARGAGSRTPS